MPRPPRQGEREPRAKGASAREGRRGGACAPSGGGAPGAHRSLLETQPRRRGPARRQLRPRPSAVGNPRLRARLLETCSPATRGSVDRARDALSEGRAGHQGACGCRPQGAALGGPGTSSSSRGSQGPLAGQEAEGAGTRPRRGTRRRSRGAGCQQLQTKPPPFPVFSWPPRAGWRSASWGPQPHALPRVQVGLGPGGSCLLTQEEPPPALLPATRHSCAGARLPSQKITEAPTGRVSLRAADWTGAAFSPSEKCSATCRFI